MLIIKGLIPIILRKPNNETLRIYVISSDSNSTNHNSNSASDHLSNEELSKPISKGTDKNKNNAFTTDRPSGINKHTGFNAERKPKRVKVRRVSKR